MKRTRALLLSVAATLAAVAIWLAIQFTERGAGEISLPTEGLGAVSGVDQKLAGVDLRAAERKLEASVSNSIKRESPPSANHRALAVEGRLADHEQYSAYDVAVAVGLRDEIGLQWASTNVTQDGSFLIAGLRAPSAYGLVTVQVHHGSLDATKTIKYTGASGDKIDVGTLYLLPARVLSVEVVDSSNLPLKGLQFYCTEPSTGGVSLPRPAVTDEFGRADVICTQRNVGLYALGEFAFSSTFSVPDEGAFQRIVAERSRSVEVEVVIIGEGVGVPGIRVEPTIPQDFVAHGAKRASVLLQPHSQGGWLTGVDGRVNIQLPTSIRGVVCLNLFCAEGGVVGNGTIEPGVERVSVGIEGQSLQPVILNITPASAPMPAVGSRFTSRDRDTLMLEVVAEGKLRVPPGQRIVTTERVYSSDAFIALHPNVRSGDHVRVEAAAPRQILIRSPEGESIAGLAVELSYDNRSVDRRHVSDQNGVVTICPIGPLSEVTVRHFFPNQGGRGESKLTFMDEPSVPVILTVDITRCTIRMTGGDFSPESVEFNGCYAKWDAAERQFACSVSSDLGMGKEITVYVPGYADQSLEWTQDGQTLECPLSSSGSIIIDSPIHTHTPAVYSLEIERSGSWHATHIQDLIVAHPEHGQLAFRSIPVGTYRVVETDSGLFSIPITIGVGALEGTAHWLPGQMSHVRLNFEGFQEGAEVEVFSSSYSAVSPHVFRAEGSQVLLIPSEVGARLRMSLNGSMTQWIEVGELAETGSVLVHPGLFKGR